MWLALTGRVEPFSGSSTVVFAKTALATTLATTIVWVTVTLLTKPEAENVLLAFYRKVRPQVTGWRPIAVLAPEIAESRGLRRNLWCWVLGSVMVYCALFGVGKLLLLQKAAGTIFVIVAAGSAWQLSRELSRKTGSE